MLTIGTPWLARRATMLKPSLQLKLGQQLTMTPQLQQAIRLLQLPALELQAHIRELLETNVMLEPTEEAEGNRHVRGRRVHPPARPLPRPRNAPRRARSKSWTRAGESRASEPAEAPWSGGGDDDERQQEFADAAGQSLQEHLLWQLELARLEPREFAIARAIVDAISDDGYLTEPLEEIAGHAAPRDRV